MAKDQVSKTLTALADEFYVAAELRRHGYVASWYAGAPDKDRSARLHAALLAVPGLAVPAWQALCPSAG